MTEELDLLPFAGGDIFNDSSTNTTEANSTSEIQYQNAQIGTESLAVIFIFFVLLLGGIVRIFSKKYRVKILEISLIQIFLIGGIHTGRFFTWISHKSI